jgi:hypothetical protein
MALRRLLTANNVKELRNSGNLLHIRLGKPVEQNRPDEAELERECTRIDRL